MKVILVCLCLFTQGHAVPREDIVDHVDAATHQFEGMNVLGLHTEVLNLHQQKLQDERAIKNTEKLIQEESKKERMPNSRDKQQVGCNSAPGMKSLDKVDADIIPGCGIEGSGESDFLDKSYTDIKVNVIHGDFSRENMGSTDIPFSEKGDDINNGRSKDAHNEPDGVNKVQSPKKDEHSRTSHNPNSSKTGMDASSHIKDIEGTPDPKLLYIDEEDSGSGHSNTHTEGTDSPIILDKAVETIDNPEFTELDKVNWNSSSGIQETGYTGALEEDEDNISTSNGRAGQDNLKTNYNETSGRQEYTDNANIWKKNNRTDYKEIPREDQVDATTNAKNPKKNSDITSTAYKNISNKNKYRDRSKSVLYNLINDINNKMKRQKGHFYSRISNGRKFADRKYDITMHQKMNKQLRKKEPQDTSSQSSGSKSDSEQSVDSSSSSEEAG